jgi:G:T-mismatch repair DNA endonuclease (very short patch repair protein)
MEQIKEWLGLYSLSNVLEKCTGHNKSPWLAIEYSNQPVFANDREFDNPLWQVHEQACRICHTPFGLSTSKNRPFIKRTCNCGDDGTKMMNFAKLSVFFDEQTCNQILQERSSKRKTGSRTWDDINLDTQPVYIGRSYMGNESMRITSKNCRCCGTEFELRHMVSALFGNGYLVHKLCKCGDDGKRQLTKEKLLVYLDDIAAELAVNDYNQNKTKGFSSTTRSWIAKGHTEEDAIELVRKEQAIRSAKSAKSRKRSVANSLFDSVDADLSITGEREKLIRQGAFVFRVDYIHEKKVIEFFGDYWHANPNIYESTSVMIGGMPASDMWIRDEKKITALRAKGLQVLVIWEQEYAADKQKVIADCLAFIQKK